MGIRKRARERENEEGFVVEISERTGGSAVVVGHE